MNNLGLDFQEHSTGAFLLPLKSLTRTVHCEVTKGTVSNETSIVDMPDAK